MLELLLDQIRRDNRYDGESKTGDVDSCLDFTIKPTPIFTLNIQLMIA
jgi:hypothetical protein